MCLLTFFPMLLYREIQFFFQFIVVFVVFMVYKRKHIASCQHLVPLRTGRVDRLETNIEKKFRIQSMGLGKFQSMLDLHGKKNPFLTTVHVTYKKSGPFDMCNFELDKRLHFALYM